MNKVSKEEIIFWLLIYLSLLLMCFISLSFQFWNTPSVFWGAIIPSFFILIAEFFRFIFKNVPYHLDVYIESMIPVIILFIPMLLDMLNLNHTPIHSLFFTIINFILLSVITFNRLKKVIHH